jgi:hypothetical protein
MRLKNSIRIIDEFLGDPISRSIKAHRRFRTIYRTGRFKKSGEVRVEIVFPVAHDDDLTSLLARHGSDKGLLAAEREYKKGHFYSYIYRTLFSAYKEKDFDFLEFGIDKGASLRAWSEYFPNARIVGVDYIRDFLFNTNRISTFEVDMYSPTSLSHFTRNVEDREFTIIIDDGPHDFLSSKTSWEACLPLFAKEFIYVCEDIPMRELNSYADFFKGEAELHGLNFYFVFFNQDNWPKELQGDNDYNTLVVVTRAG